MFFKFPHDFHKGFPVILNTRKALDIEAMVSQALTLDLCSVVSPVKVGCISEPCKKRFIKAFIPDLWFMENYMRYLIQESVT